jgi:hypothetical protein
MVSPAACAAGDRRLAALRTGVTLLMVVLTATAPPTWLSENPLEEANHCDLLIRSNITATHPNTNACIK